MESGIYMIRNRLNSKRYIGSALNLEHQRKELAFEFGVSRQTIEKILLNEKWQVNA